MKLIGTIISWLARKQLKEVDWIAYQKGWEAGVEQQRYDPESTLHYETVDEEGKRWNE